MPTAIMFDKFDTEILMYLDIERLRRKVIPGRDPVRYPLDVRYIHPFERIRFTMKCVHCKQISPISHASLLEKLKSIDMYQALNARSINHFPYHRYPFIMCPKCKRVIMFPHWMRLIDRNMYVPALVESALEIGWMDMRDEYKDWVDGPYYLDLDSMCSIAAHEAEPGYWFISDRNRYLCDLKVFWRPYKGTIIDWLTVNSYDKKGKFVDKRPWKG